MTEKVSAMEARRRFGDILNRVVLRHDQYVIERKGKALAAVVPVEKLERLEALSRQHVLDVLKRSSGVLSQREAERLADEAKLRSRRKARPKKRPR